MVAGRAGAVLLDQDIVGQGLEKEKENVRDFSKMRGKDGPPEQGTK